MPEIAVDAFFVETDDEAINRARRDYCGVLGTVIYPQWLFGFKTGTDITQELCVEYRVGVKVRVTSPDSVINFCGEFCDPIWDVEIVDDPQGLTAELEYNRAWVYGQSYETPHERR